MQRGDKSFNVDRSHVQGVGVVTLRGEIDIAATPDLRQALADVVATSTSVVVDLRDVTFLDSTALGALVGARNRFRKKTGSIHLVAVSEAVTRIFELTRLDVVFPIHDSLDEALQASTSSV